jgi:predicted RNA-binding protein with PIN domain
MTTVLVDAENVRRSQWPNLSRDDLVERAQAWGAREGHEVLVIFEGKTSADDEIVRLAHELDGDVWVATSDRGLRERIDDRASRIIGGGAFLRELLESVRET